MEPTKKYARTPIVEAVVDIDCDTPPAFNLAEINPFLEAWGDQFPNVETIHGQHIQFEVKDPSKLSHHSVGILAQQFRPSEGNPVVQARQAGFSYNRLAPYTSLDDYLSQIHHTWELYRKVVQPLAIRCIRLKYINRLLLPLENGRLELSEFFTVCPTLPKEAGLDFTGFFRQDSAVETATGHTAQMVLLAQPPESDHLPVIFDVTVAAQETADPENWGWVLQKIGLLRMLKQKIFENTLTPTCLEPYQL